MAEIIVGAALDLAWSHRQNRLHAIERLDLRLLVRAQNQSAVRRVEIEPHNIAHLLHQLRIGREFEGFAAMRTQPESAPDPAYRHPANSRPLGHLAGCSNGSRPWAWSQACESPLVPLAHR